VFEKSVYRKWVETLKLYTRQRHDIQGPYGVFCVDLSYVLASFSRHGIQGPFCVFCVNLSTCWHLFLDTTFKGLFVFFG
jgi:hypothetical protein